MQLTKGTTVQLRGADGIEVRCSGGQLWLTEAGDPTDYFLEGDASHRVRTHQAVVIEALSDAVIEILRLPVAGTSRTGVAPRPTPEAT